MAKANNDIRERAQRERIYLYEIANAIGVSEPTLIRKLRYELPLEEKNKYFEAIERIKSEQKAGATV